MKRTLKIFQTAIALLLISCILAGCSSPIISDRVMNSMLGAYQYAGDLAKQIKDEGLGSVAAIFKSGDDEEDGETADAEDGASISDSGDADSAEDSANSEE